MGLGIRCPACGCRDLRDENLSREWEVQKTEKKPGFIRRRLKCRYCGKVVYTREVVEK